MVSSGILYIEYAPKLIFYFSKKYPLLRAEEVEDAVQDGFYCYLESAPLDVRYSKKISYAWLKTVIHRVLFKYSKAKKNFFTYRFTRTSVFNPRFY